MDNMNNNIICAIKRLFLLSFQPHYADLQGLGELHAQHGGTLARWVGQ